MNNARRKELEKAFGLIEEAAAILELVRDDEQEAYGNLSENLQNSERGEAMSEAVDALTEAVDSCDEIKANIETAKE